MIKRILNLVCLVGASLALGLGIGAQVNLADKSMLILIANIAAGVLYVLAIIFSALVIRDASNRKNEKVSLQKQDFILQMGATYQVQKRGKLHAGEYTVLATDENNKTFNLRINDLVKEYQHNTVLILAEGDTISARSGNVILR